MRASASSRDRLLAAAGREFAARGYAGASVDRIATAENIDVSEEELNRELGRLAEPSGESAAAIRARLTKQGALDRMKSKLRSDKTLDWLYQNSRVRAVAAGKS